MWRREQRSLAAELVADCRAFLLGQYADRLESLAIAVPVWAWTNLLAHASESELRVEALSSGDPGRGNNGWHAARAYLAAEVLEVAAQSGTLDALQEESLVPLEMDLAARADVRGWDSRRWVGAVRAALANRRSPHA